MAVKWGIVRLPELSWHLSQTKRQHTPLSAAGAGLWEEEEEEEEEGERVREMKRCSMM